MDSREPRPSGPPGGAALPRRSRHCRGGTAAGGRARARTRRVSRGRASTARSCRPGVLVLQPPAVSPAPARLGLMYRALYAFRSAEPNALAFAAGETFLVLERSSAHWWLAARARSGETGYVPPAYLRRLQVSVPLPGPASAAPRLSSITGRSGPPADEDFENLTERPRGDWDPESPLPPQRTRPLTANS